jgi:hydroxymethylpyrimidine/phosphomethylpyrimidine kinase
VAAHVVTALTIAGVDSSGGAGVVADLKTFEAHGLWGACAVTAVTAQNVERVRAIEVMPASLVRDQILAVAPVAVVKTGMLGSAAVVQAVADALIEIGRPPLVVDPVLVSTSGTVLLHGGSALTKRLLPLATVVTPNMAEARALTGEDDPIRAARAMGAPVVMITGGDSARDLVWDGTEHWLEGQRIDSVNTHGTGCVLSAAIAAELARGMEPVDACVAGKAFVTEAIAAGVAGAVNPAWERGSSSAS